MSIEINYDYKLMLLQMEQVCLLHLDEGKASSWPVSFKKSIIARYINSQKDLQELLASKRGWWSMIKGFILWLYSFFDNLINGGE